MEVSTDPTAETMNMYNYVNNFLANPIIYILLLIILILYFVFFYSLGNKTTEYSSSNASSSSGSLATILIILLVAILLFVNGITYFFGVNLAAYITGLFTGNPVVNILVD